MPEGLQRVGVLCSGPDILAEHGVDADALARELGLDPAALRNPDAFIPYTAMGRYVEACARRTGLAHFGLLVGLRATTAALGVVGALMRNAPDLGRAMADLVTHQPRYVRGAAIFLFRAEAEFMFGYVSYQPGTPGRDQIQAGALAGGMRLVAELTGIAPRAVMLAQAAPADPALRQLYARCLGAPVQFDSEISALAFPRAQLRLPVIGADPTKRAELEKLILNYAPMGALPSFAQSVRHALVSRIAWNRCTLAETARLFDLHPRAMERRLQAAGTSFAALRDEARFEVSCQLLSATGLSLGRIGAAIGYAEQAVFSRAFRRWSGVAPSAWRRANALQG
ncbi:AraC family transcriptional regulator [Sediminicoccus sp. KRV36]|uniref:AraC family transcriptional regulator n=1 Tax=Sediminicoccus sp. KRV36 TaxID=3133721 RepID=UPI00200DE11A|nr:AraC family transcriptional regulator [Sediminicoccus rosea]UPY38447.1 AraC family transcriptional regulator [Sediminicoccus rosea]